MSNPFALQPLTTALGAIAAHRADIAQAAAQQLAFTAEYEAGMRTVDPRDEAMLTLLNKRKQQADMMPTFIERAEEKREPLFNKLIAEIRVMESQLIKGLKADQEAFFLEWKGHFKPLLKGLNGEAEALLERLAQVMTGSKRHPRMPRGQYEAIGVLTFDDGGDGRCNLRLNWQDAIIARAEELLKIAKEYQPFVAGSAKG